MSEPLGCYIPLADAEPEAADGDGLPGTTPALEPATEPEHPLRAMDVPALLPKEIG